MENILRFHAQKYPFMQPVDAVKLIYQSEFGIGHLIENTAWFEKKLQDEISTVEIHPGIPLTEPIGSGMIRVMLNSPDFSAVNTNDLVSACRQTADMVHGSAEHFQKKLNELRTFCREDRFCFTVDELETFLELYKQNGYRPVSHSDLYRQMYFPAYRVIKDIFLDMLQ